MDKRPSSSDNGAAGGGLVGGCLGPSLLKSELQHRPIGPSQSPSPVALLLQLPQPFLTSLRHKGSQSLPYSKPHSGSHRSGHAPARSLASEAQHRGDLQPHLQRRHLHPQLWLWSRWTVLHHLSAQGHLGLSPPTGLRASEHQPPPCDPGASLEEECTRSVRSPLPGLPGLHGGACWAGL